MKLKTSVAFILAFIVSTTAAALSTPLSSAEAKSFAKELVRALKSPQSNINSRLLLKVLSEAKNDQDLTLSNIAVERTNESAIYLIEWSYSARNEGHPEGILITAEVIKNSGTSEMAYVFNFRSERLVQIQPLPGASQGTKKGF